MPQIGGKNAKKTSSDSKRHFTVVMGNKEHGLYVSSTPSSAARKAITKLCASNKGKKVEFHIREITQGSKKKTYGPYSGYIEKLKEPIELKGRVIKYKPVAKLSGKSGVKKGGMYRASGGPAMSVIKKCFHDRKNEGNIETTLLRQNPSRDSDWAKYATGRDILLHKKEPVEILETQIDPISGEEFGRVVRNGVSGWVRMRYITCEIIPQNIEVTPSLAKARQLWQNSKQPILPNIPNYMLNNINQPRPSAQRHKFTKGASSAHEPQKSPKHDTHISSGFSIQPANLSGFSIQPAQPRQPTFLSGMSDVPRNNHIYGPSSASSAHELQNSPETEYSFYEQVLKEAKGRPIEKVSNDEYIIHINEMKRIIIGKQFFLPDDRNAYIITKDIEKGPRVPTEEYYDSEIDRLIESRLHTSQIYLSELLELCSDIYNNMFKTPIPNEKLKKIQEQIMQSYSYKKNGQNILFFKL